VSICCDDSDEPGMFTGGREFLDMLADVRFLRTPCSVELVGEVTILLYTRGNATDVQNISSQPVQATCMAM
jgi:hypothetical protein